MLRERRMGQAPRKGTEARTILGCGQTSFCQAAGEVLMRFEQSEKISCPWLVLVGGLLFVASLATPAAAIEVQCGAAADGDAFGWAVASGGDYDGDGVADIAVGAPCAWVGTKEKVGRVRVFSGATGHLLVSLAGSTPKERYGSALDFIPDLNGDGKAELAIGASTFDAPTDAGSPRTGAGRVEIRSAAGGGTVLWEVRGSNAFANLGETVAALPDLSGDGKAEVAIGASNASVIGQPRRRCLRVLRGEWGPARSQRRDLQGRGLGQPRGPRGGRQRRRNCRLAGLVQFREPSSAGSELMAPAPAASTTTTTTTTTSTTTTTLLDRAGRLAVLSGVPPFEVLTETLR